MNFFHSYQGDYGIRGLLLEIDDLNKNGVPEITILQRFIIATIDISYLRMGWEKFDYFLFIQEQSGCKLFMG